MDDARGLMALSDMADGSGDRQRDDDRDVNAAVVRLHDGHMGQLVHGYAEAEQIISFDEVAHDSGGEAEPDRILMRRARKRASPEGAASNARPDAIPVYKDQRLVIREQSRSGQGRGLSDGA